jgi:hypothetical protein
MASRSDKSGATGGGAPQREVAVIESALADELVAMTLEQTELLQRTGAGRPMGRRSRTWSTATRFRGPAGSSPPPAFALVIARAAHPARIDGHEQAPITEAA